MRPNPLHLSALLLLVQLANAQDSTLSDVFPISIGNRWTYQYHSKFDETNQWYGYTDTGKVTLDVVNFISQADSIRWIFQQRRDIIRNSYSYGKPPGSEVIIDTTSFEVIEQLSGRHRLYRNQHEANTWESVIPWSYLLIDTTFIFRYAPTDSSGIIRILTRTKSLGRKYILTFKRGIGQESVHCDSKDVIVFESYETNHTLLSSVITSIPIQLGSTVPATIDLAQNYPNPFNSTSTITLTVGKYTPAKVSVFNLLGEQVLTLFDGWLTPGAYSFRWEAGSLPSGVYIYKMVADGSSLAKKALLLK